MCDWMTEVGGSERKDEGTCGWLEGMCGKRLRLSGWMGDGDRRMSRYLSLDEYLVSSYG